MHPATEFVHQFFTYEHLPDDLQHISKPFCDLADAMVEILPENQETTAMLRKLLEAKDCAVRARISGPTPSRAPKPESAVCGETYGKSMTCFLKPGHSGAHEGNRA